MGEIAVAEATTRLLVSLAIGVAIGLEREFRGVAAGFRTHSLVVLGATLFTIAGVVLTGKYYDATRIAAQIAIGIGFIGGGVIFKSSDKVFGLTTAAGLWTVAALGVVIGFGEYAIGIIGAVLVLLVLFVGKLVETRYFLKPAEEYPQHTVMRRKRRR